MNKIGVIGSGTMGNGIAHVCAQFGFDVLMVDVQEAALTRAISQIEKNLNRQAEKGLLEKEKVSEVLGRIQTTTQYNEELGSCDLIIEAASENPQIKFQIFKQLDELCKPETILATNTSSI